VQSTPLFTRSGEPLGMISTYFGRPHRPTERELRITDLYARQAAELIERRRADEALRQSGDQSRLLTEKLAHMTRLTTMGELAASLAHELKQPLAAIVTNGGACLRWLAHDRPNLDETVTAVQRIIRDANRAADVIVRTRALFRKSSTEKVRLDLAEVIREVLMLAHPEVVRHRIVVHESLAKDLPLVLGDRTQLQQVLLNLIVNGIQAMSEVTDRSRDLTIRAQPHELDASPVVLVAVEDSGIGLAPEALNRLFEAFYTTKSQGLGLGLSISRSLVQAHGGRLWATRNPKQGATFEFVLPVPV
jgi:C4-dicarboxylate-specific signal transduction histidine kinase